MKGLLIKWGIGGGIVIILVPIIVNLLMIPKTGAIGQPDTWITFFGSYVGAILSGLLTLIGVLLTINYTVKQNAINQNFTYHENLEQIKFTRDENMRMLEENRRENRRNKLPEMIYHLESCLDFLEEKSEEVERFDKEDILDTLRKLPHERSLSMFQVDKNYHVEMQKHTKLITKVHLRKIRDFIVKADVPAYDAFLEFKDNLNEAYNDHILPVSRQFSNFTAELVENRIETYVDVIVDSNSALSDISLTTEDENRMNELKTHLYTCDREYLSKVIRIYWNFEEKLQAHLHDLVNEYNKV